VYVCKFAISGRVRPAVIFLQCLVYRVLHNKTQKLALSERHGLPSDKAVIGIQ
jgi:hypothetical protein